MANMIHRHPSYLGGRNILEGVPKRLFAAVTAEADYCGGAHAWNVRRACTGGQLSSYSSASTYEIE